MGEMQTESMGEIRRKIAFAGALAGRDAAVPCCIEVIMDGLTDG
jgi:hypothetical protein